jgi:hypothetical protein
LAASHSVRRARRVLPTPPDPVSVSSRVTRRSRSARTAAASLSRPMSGVGGTGNAEAKVSHPDGLVNAMPARLGAAASRTARSFPERSRASASARTVWG